MRITSQRSRRLTKIWKTLVYRAVRVNQQGEVIEVLGESNDEKEANRIAAEAESIEGLTIEVQSKATNDRSGKATPVDRILIMAPESQIHSHSRKIRNYPGIHSFDRVT